jgi:peptidoglycan/LPS O-acetylase OafA/YrhL
LIGRGCRLPELYTMQTEMIKPNRNSMKTRIYFLDNLRTFLIFLVVLLHAAITYCHGMDSFWPVVDPQKSEGLSLVNMYLDLFVMFIIFFISGYFIPYSVKSKNSRDFIGSKFRRIMVPWLLAVLTLIPAYKAIFLYSRGLPQEAWYSYFTFFQRAGSDLHFYPNHPTQSWLWFLPILFIFQVAYLGLSKINLPPMKISLKTAAVIILVVGIIHSMSISVSGLKGWFHSAVLDFQRERLLIYFMSFLLGALCFKQKVFESGEKNMRYYIIANVVLTLALGVFTAVALNLFFNIIEPTRNYFIVSETADKIAYYSTAIFSMLSFLYVFIHVFRFNFNKTSMLMKYLNKSSYSVYIIHMIVLSVLALALVPVDISGFIKFIILTITTYVLSNAIVIAYYRWFQTNLSLRFGTFAVLVIALLAFIRFGNKAQGAADRTLPKVIQSQNPHTPDMGIHEAVIRGDLAIVKQYILLGADLDEREPSGGSSPLITAAVFGKTDIAQALIEAGVNVNFQNNEGSTPLHSAAFFCRTEIVKLLLESGADTGIMNRAGTTAIQSVSGSFESVQGIYDYFRQAFGPMGLELDDEVLKETRPMIQQMLSNQETK